MNLTTSTNIDKFCSQFDVGWFARVKHELPENFHFVQKRWCHIENDDFVASNGHIGIDLRRFVLPFRPFFRTLFKSCWTIRRKKKKKKQPKFSQSKSSKPVAVQDKFQLQQSDCYNQMQLVAVLVKNHASMSTEKLFLIVFVWVGKKSRKKKQPNKTYCLANKKFDRSLDVDQTTQLHETQLCRDFHCLATTSLWFARVNQSSCKKKRNFFLFSFGRNNLNTQKTKFKNHKLRGMCQCCRCITRTIFEEMNLRAKRCVKRTDSIAFFVFGVQQKAGKHISAATGECQFYTIISRIGRRRWRERETTVFSWFFRTIHWNRTGNGITSAATKRIGIASQEKTRK